MNKELLNEGWIFFKEGHENEAQDVCLPHDAMIFEKRVPNCLNAYDTGYYPGGSYVYRKDLTGLCFAHGLLEFDGVFGHTEVILNGVKLKENVYGYTNFFVELDSAWNGAGKNLLEVRVDNSIEGISRWYTGSGIYREVALYTADRAWIDPEKVFLTTESIGEEAVISVKTSYCTGQDAQLRVIFMDGDTIAAQETQRIEAGRQDTETVIRVPMPKLWSAENPYLYTVRLDLLVDGEVVDSHTERFGIRTLNWSTSTGFAVNGKRVKLLGGCLHHDNGMLGAVSTKEMELRRVRLFKEVGFNAIRSAHNPASKALLEACDELGLYVLDESFDVWYNPKGNNVFQYSRYFRDWWKNDTQSMVRRDYNHPSVIMYSVGNEIFETAFPKGIETAAKMREAIRELDTTRPVTCCVNLFMNLTAKSGDPIEVDWEKAEKPAPIRDFEEDFTSSKQFNVIMGAMSKLIKAFVGISKVDEATKGVFAQMDVAGYNYGIPRYGKDRKLHPERLILGSETVSCDVDQNVQATLGNDNVIGDFIWTAMDHLGESGIGILDYKEHAFYKPYPCILNGCGVIGLNGVLRPMAALAQIAYGKRSAPCLAVEPFGHEKERLGGSSYQFTNALHSWDYEGFEGRKSKVYVLTDAARVELYLNGKKIGTKKRGKRAFVCFNVAYQSGRLMAKALDRAGKLLGTDELVTPGQELKIAVNPEKAVAAAGELLYIPIELTDNCGVLKTQHDQMLDISVTGAELLAFGSEDPYTEETYHGTQAKSYQGRAMAILRAGSGPEDICVTVSVGKVKSSVSVPKKEGV